MKIVIELLKERREVEYVHKYFIWFNNCTDLEIGIKAVKRPFFPSLKKRYREQQIDGKDGTDYKIIGYENRILVVEYNFIDRKNIHEKVRRIRRWLDNIKDKRLWEGDDPSYFYIVKKVEYDDIERKLKTIGKFKVTFTLEPFAYSFYGAEELKINNGDMLYNGGDFESKPIITIQGEGDIKLWINESLIELNLTMGKTTINSKLELCYKDTLDNPTNKYMKGDFPVLKLDENTIRWEGNIESINIIPNYIYY